MRALHHEPRNLGHLRDIGLFRGCSDKQLAQIDRLVCVQEARAGAVLCRQGVFGRQAFFIVSGQAEVTIDDVPVATLGAGGFFGELSVLDGERRVATVTAATQMTLLVSSTRELEQLLVDLPQVARRMLVTVGGRLRHADRSLSATRH